MGTIARQSRARRFVDEFGSEIARVASANRQHTVTVATDDDGCVRLWLILGDYEYMSDYIIFDPEFTETDADDFTDDLLSLLGYKDTKDNRKKLRGRVERMEKVV